MDRSGITIRFIGYLICCVFLLGTACAASWEETKINGRGYVSLNSLEKNYSLKQTRQSGKTIVLENKKIRMRLAVGTTDCNMNGVKFILSYPVLTSNGKPWISRIDLSKLIDPVIRPKFIKEAGNFNTVIIDAGHGGHDRGCSNSLGTEAYYNLNIAKTLQQILTQQKYKVVMTRSDNRYLTLQERVNLANQIKENAIFISIHQNSSRNSKARGIETFTLSPVGVTHYGRALRSSDFRASTGNGHDSANVALATAVHGTLLTTLIDPKSKKPYTIDRGIKRARFNVLSGVKHPAILVECGFLTNPTEGRYIHNDAYRRTIARSIAAAIARYRNAVGGSSTGPGQRMAPGQQSYSRGPSVTSPPGK